MAMSSRVSAAAVTHLSAPRQRDLEPEERMWSITLIESLPPELRRRMALAAIVHLARSSSDAEDLSTAAQASRSCCATSQRRCSSAACAARCAT
jgi:hypothetical protein